MSSSETLTLQRQTLLQTFFRAMAIAAPMATGASAWSQNAPAPNIFDAARETPADVDFFLAIQDAGELRRCVIGDAANASAEALAGYSQTFGAWFRLAAQLDLKPAAAFDDLLGRRVVVAGRDGQAGAEPAWVILSDVSRATAKRISERLKPMPRALLRGTPVLAVEEGAFELGLIEKPRAAGVGVNADAIAADPGFTMVLAPRESDKLFDEIAQLVGNAVLKPLADTEEFGEVKLFRGRASAVLFTRLKVQAPGVAAQGGADPAANPAPPSWIGAAFTREGDSIRVQSVMRLPALDPIRAGAAQQCADGRARWSAAAFENLAKDAVLASMETGTLVAGGRWASPFGELVREVPWIAGQFDGVHLLSGRLAGLVRASPTGMFDVAVGLETSDTAALAVQGDKAVAGAITQAMPPKPNEAPPDAAALDFGGVEPAAMRNMDVSNLLGPKLSDTWKGGARLAWRYAPSAIPPNDPALQLQPLRGWWVIGIGAETVEAAAAALTAAPADADLQAPWIGMLSIQPARAIDVFDAHDIDLPRPADALRWVKQLRWNTIVGPRGLIFGGGFVEFERPAAKR